MSKLQSSLIMKVMLDQLFEGLPETELERQNGGSGQDAASNYQFNLQRFSDNFNRVFEHQLPSLDPDDNSWDENENYLGPKPK